MIPERIRQQNLKLLVSVIPQSFKTMVVRASSTESTPRVLPLPVIHTNSFLDHRGASLQILFSKEFPGPIYRSLNFQELLLDNSVMEVALRRIPPQELLLAYSSLKTLILRVKSKFPNSQRKSTFSMCVCKGLFSLSNSQEENQTRVSHLCVGQVDLPPINREEFW